MSKSHIDKACAVVPEFENRISRFDKKLRIDQYAEHSIYDYKLKVAQAVMYLQKLPDDFTQDENSPEDWCFLPFFRWSNIFVGNKTINSTRS